MKKSPSKICNVCKKVRNQRNGAQALLLNENES